MENNRSYIAKKLKKVLKEKKITSKKLSKQIGYSPSAVSMWILGKRELSIDALILICKYLEIPISYLVDNSYWESRTAKGLLILERYDKFPQYQEAINKLLNID